MKKLAPGALRTNLLIVILLQAVLYSGLWLWDEYVASYFTLILPGIILAILLLSTISDFIEPSRIPGWYYWIMFVSILTPLIVGALFYSLYGGQLDWLVFSG